VPHPLETKFLPNKRCIRVVFHSHDYFSCYIFEIGVTINVSSGGDDCNVWLVLINRIGPVLSAIPGSKIPVDQGVRKIKPDLVFARLVMKRIYQCGCHLLHCAVPYKKNSPVPQ
jgi:hypothetical protein